MAARVRKLTKEELAELKALPRGKEKHLEGGSYPLAWLANGNPFGLPTTLNLWVDAKGYLRSCQLVRPGETTDNGQTALIEALLKLIIEPGKKAEKVLPERIIVNQAGLAELLGRFLAPLKIEVVFEPQPVALTRLFTQLATIVGPAASPSLDEPFSLEVAAEPELLTELFRAFNGMWKHYPSEAVSADWPIEIKTGSLAPDTEIGLFYASLRERYDQPTSIVFYSSLDSFEQDKPNLPKLGEVTPPADEEFAQILGRLTLIHLELAKLFLPDELIVFIDQLKAKDRTPYYADCFKLYFERVEDVAPTYLKWLSTHKLRYSSRQAVPVLLHQNAYGSQRSLTIDEVRDLITALGGLGYLFYAEGRILDPLARGGVAKTHRVTLQAGKFFHFYNGKDPANAWANVTFPLAGVTVEANETTVKDDDSAISENTLTLPLDRLFSLQRNPDTHWLELALNEAAIEGPDTPPTILGPRLLYVLQVRLAWLPTTWRRIELRGDQTLLDLHYIIQEAFGWDDDHLYSFFLSGQRWDERSEYSGPWSETGRNVALHRLESLHLRPGQEFLYLFDYGDDLEHIVKVESVQVGGVQPRRSYPRITEREGKSVPQYDDWSEEDEDDEE